MPVKLLFRSRYSIVEATLRVQKAISRSRPRLLDKDVAKAIGMSVDVFSRKMNRNRSEFTLDELGAIADFFNAPPGWPILDADVVLGKKGGSSGSD